MSKAFSGKFRVSTIATTPIGEVVDGSQYGKGARVTLVPSEVPADNPLYDRDSSVRGELHIGVLSAKASKAFEVGQEFTLTLES